MCNYFNANISNNFIFMCKDTKKKMGSATGSWAIRRQMNAAVAMAKIINKTEIASATTFMA